MQRILSLAFQFVWAIALIAPAFAQDDGAERLGRLEQKSGLVRIESMKAQMEVPPGWRFISAPELLALFNIPGDSTFIGWLVVEGTDISSPQAWFIDIYEWEADHLVADVENFDPYRLVWRTRDVYKTEQKHLQFYKNEAYEFINYATIPSYDSANAIVSWTERIRYPYNQDTPEALDVFGMKLARRGAIFMELSYVPEAWHEGVESAIKSLLLSVKFDVGERYQDASPAEPRDPIPISEIVSGQMWFHTQPGAARKYKRQNFVQMVYELIVRHDLLAYLLVGGGVILFFGLLRMFGSAPAKKERR